MGNSVTRMSSWLGSGITGRSLDSEIKNNHKVKEKLKKKLRSQ